MFKEMSKDQAYLCIVLAALLFTIAITISLRWSVDWGINTIAYVTAGEVALAILALWKYREWYAWASLILLVLAFISGCGVAIANPIH